MTTEERLEALEEEIELLRAVFDGQIKRFLRNTQMPVMPIKQQQKVEKRR